MTDMREALKRCRDYIQSPLRMTRDEDEQARRDNIIAQADAALAAPGEPVAWADSEGRERPIDAEAMKALKQNPTTEAYWSRFSIPLYRSASPRALDVEEVARAMYQAAPSRMIYPEERVLPFEEAPAEYLEKIRVLARAAAAIAKGSK